MLLPEVDAVASCTVGAAAGVGAGAGGGAVVGPGVGPPGGGGPPGPGAGVGDEGSAVETGVADAGAGLWPWPPPELCRVAASPMVAKKKAAGRRGCCWVRGCVCQPTGPCLRSGALTGEDDDEDDGEDAPPVGHGVAGSDLSTTARLALAGRVVATPWG